MKLNHFICCFVGDKKIIHTFSKLNFVIISMSDNENNAKNVFIP